MQTTKTKHGLMRCSLDITTNARKGIVKYAKDEHAFFHMQDAFYVAIEKRPQNRHGNMSFTIFFDNEKNEQLAKQLDDRVAVMECVYKNEGFVATGFHLRGKREPVHTNRRYIAKLKFNTVRGAVSQMPIELYTALRELPIAEERSAYVEKRIASWEGYLRIQEMNADVEDVKATFTLPSFNEDFSKLRLICSGLEGKDWHAIKGFSAKIVSLGQDIGNVHNTNRSKKMVEIDLNPKYREMARRNEWHLKSHREVIFSNFAELSQVRRLRKGFKDLQNGLAANANLEKVLFEERPVVRISKEQKELEFHSQLNEFQKEAVTGAMTANDLYVIQGPPGTGKTTVIAEICYQNVKAGLKTLVASQANLAVDNALGRLLAHQDIRILRYGRTESIEEEGKKFIEENVASNWKEQTAAAVNENLQAYRTKAQRLEDELATLQETLVVLQDEKKVLEEKIELKKQAEKDYLALASQHMQVKKRVEIFHKDEEKLTSKQDSVKKAHADAIEEVKRLEQRIEEGKISPEMFQEMDEVKAEIASLQQLIAYDKTTGQVNEASEYIKQVEHEITRVQTKIEERERFLEETVSVLKLDVLQQKLSDLTVTIPPTTAQKMTLLQQNIEELKRTMSSEQNSDWQQLNARLDKAIEMTESLLKNHGFMMQSAPKAADRKYTTTKEINALVDRIGQFLVNPATKKILATRNYSAEKYETHEKIAIALDILKKQRNFVQAQGVNLVQQNAMIQHTKEQYSTIKKEVIEYVNEIIRKEKREQVAKEQLVEEQYQRVEQYKEQLASYPSQLATQIESFNRVAATEKLCQQEQTYTAFLEQKTAVDHDLASLSQQNSEANRLDNEMKEHANSLESLAVQSAALTEEKAQQETQLATLKAIIEEDIETKRAENLNKEQTLLTSIDKTVFDKEQLPVVHSLQKEWANLLEEANEYDLDEIRKLYVQHANVIGTTCVASARRDFVEEYPDFDVVIIDEVSKATPPELLLPMLKGKKIILVGDHHQLPPLMGQETLEELLEESTSFEEKKELEKLLKESLFERLFRTLPKQNKTMLGIQYRMHETIMETITSFYAEGEYRLKCGLSDSDAMRDHLITSPSIKRENHLLWFDMPNEPAYFEAQPKGGTSRFNQAELTKIKTLLNELETATIEAKQQGLMKQNEKKSVGVISFYGEQVKRIDRLIEQDINPQHLHCRTGSVDKFQGMEMDIIILSFVRNHDHKGGDIGFAKDYRRLNVALSRARELLVIVGSSKMFTERTKDANARNMYRRLLQHVQAENGYQEEVLNL